MNPFNFAREIQLQSRKLGLTKSNIETETEYQRFISESQLVEATKSQYESGHFREAILNAYICVNNLVKEKAVSEFDGSKLMKNVLSVNNPKLKLNDLTNQSAQDEQLGYMEIFSGCMTGIRNPRAHETNWPDDKKSALVLLIWANHLIKIIKRSTANF